MKPSIKIFTILLTLALFFTQESKAQTDIFVRGAGRLIPLALPKLCAVSGAVEQAVRLER